MTADRREAINQYIQSRGEVRLKELEQRYTDVSSMTLRRDLEFLERQGRIVRIRGGAKSLAHLSMLKEAAYTQRQVANTDAKLVIADKAIRLLSPGRPFTSIRVRPACVLRSGCPTRTCSCSRRPPTSPLSWSRTPMSRST
jgi:DeoR/GlpR family transcriptional regulator of sugar metabolism